MAQQQAISGRVFDRNGRPLENVSVKVRGSAAVAVTDRNGRFSLTSVPSNGVLLFTMIGYEAKEFSVSGSSSVSVTLDVKSTDLDEVVVTALGIKRQEKSLGYATTTVKGEQLTDALSSNWTDALSGKVAGLNLVRSNAGPTGSNKIILRGENNLTGDNEALIVVDGVIINSGSGRRTAIAGEDAYGTSSDNMPVDYGSSINDINPEDIESVSVLKGPGAAALYGQQAANGAIIITTKSGRNKKGLGITVNSNASMETINRWPDLQYEYGQGIDGASYYSYGSTVDGSSTSGTSSAYGPKFDGQYFFQYDPVLQGTATERTLWKPYKNQVRDFFESASTFTNSVTLDGGTDKTSARFSVTNVNNSWIAPNTGYERTSVALSVNSKINKKLTVNSKVNYTNKGSDNLPGAGYGNQSLMYWFIFWQPNADINWLKDYWVNGQEGRKIKYPYSSYPENPYAVSYEFLNKSSRNGVTGNAQATYDFNKEFSLQLRASIDMSNEARAQERPYDAGARYQRGSYRTQNIFSQEVTADFLARYKKKISEDVEISATAGGSTRRNRYNRDEVRADSLVYPGVYSMSNNAGPLVTLPYKSSFDINSFYGLLTAAYKDYLFVDVTGRQDWNSVLATLRRTSNAGFFYPSANLSFVLSDAIAMPKSIDFAKVRFSVSGVGSGQTTPYRTTFNYATAGSIYNGGLVNPSVLANPNLQPLKTTTYELGAEAHFFNDRVTIDAAVYKGDTKNQILERIVDRASGYSRVLFNAGEISNKGIELALGGTPLKNKNFTWIVDATFSANRNRIEALQDSSVVLQSRSVGNGQIVAKMGGSMGDLYGRGYVRSPDGQVVYDKKTGFALITEDLVHLGNTLPKGKVSLSNTFKYKQFRLSFLFDAQYGAVAHSLMNYKLAEQGKTSITLPGRYNGIIGNGVVQNDDGTYSPNTTIATNIDEYYRSHYGQDNAEGNTFSTDFIKFREARFDFTLTPRMARRLGAQKATIGVYGRNLFIWSPWPMFDPEFGTISGTDIVQGFEIAQFPSTRTFGANLVIEF